MFYTPSHYKGSPLIEAEFKDAFRNQGKYNARYEKGLEHGEFRAAQTKGAEGYKKGLRHGFNEGKDYGYKKGSFDMWNNDIPGFNPKDEKVVFTDEGKVFTWNNYNNELTNKTSPLFQEMKRIQPEVKQTYRKDNFVKKYHSTKPEVDFTSDDKTRSFKVFNKTASDYDPTKLKNASGYNNYFSFNDKSKAFVNPYDTSQLITYKSIDNKRGSPIIGFLEPPVKKLSSTFDDNDKGKEKVKKRRGSK